MFAQRILEKNGYHVIIASNGQEAAELHAQQTFDAILMDIQMPDVDGLSATATIRDREAVAGGHIPIVAMTAHAMKGDQERCLEAGMDAYLSKPVCAEELLATLQAVISIAGREHNPPPAQRDEEGHVFDEAEVSLLAGGDIKTLDELVELN